MSKLVSIVTPCYNAEATIARTIDSVIAQSYDNWEMLIFDDCSTDQSRNIIESYSQKDPRIKIFSSDRNAGAAHARNHLIENASGSYIAFVDSDDYWCSDKLSKQIDFMVKKSAPFSFTAYYAVNDKGTKKLIQPQKKITYKRLLYSNSIGCSTAIYSVDMLGKCYMPNIRKRQDFGLWLNILKESGEAYCMQEPLTFYSRLKGSLSDNKAGVARYQWFFYRHVLNFSTLRTLWYFTWYSLFGAKKRWL